MSLLEMTLTQLTWEEEGDEIWVFNLKVTRTSGWRQNLAFFHWILRLGFVLLTASEFPSWLLLFTVSWLKFKLRSFIFRFLDLTHEEGRKRKGKERKAYILWSLSAPKDCPGVAVFIVSTDTLCPFFFLTLGSDAGGRRESAWRKKQQAV